MAFHNIFVTEERVLVSEPNVALSYNLVEAPFESVLSSCGHVVGALKIVFLPEYSVAIANKFIVLALDHVEIAKDLIG